MTSGAMRRSSGTMATPRRIAPNVRAASSGPDGHQISSRSPGDEPHGVQPPGGQARTPQHLGRRPLVGQAGVARERHGDDVGTSPGGILEDLEDRVVVARLGQGLEHEASRIGGWRGAVKRDLVRWRRLVGWHRP